MFSGLSGNSMLGEYRISAQALYSVEPVNWTLTVTVNGLVEWIEEGELVYMPQYSSDYTYDDDYDDDYDYKDYADDEFDHYTDDDSTYYYDDDVSTYISSDSSSRYSSTGYPKTDKFTVILDSYDPTGC